MADEGPWTDFQPQAPQPQAGPWSDYAPAAPAEQEPAPKSFLDRLHLGDALADAMKPSGQELATENTFASSQFAKQWAADKLKGGNYASFLAGGAGAFAAGAVESVRSAFVTAKKVFEGEPVSEEEQMNAAMVAAFGTTGGFRAAPLKVTPTGEFSRVTTAGGQPVEQPVGGLPREQDFQNGAKALTPEAKGTLSKIADVAEQNLRDLWQQQGIHPAEAVVDARSDAFLKHDLTTEPTPVIIAYHGSNATFDKFDSRFLGTGVGGPASEEGHFFTSDPKVASGFSGLDNGSVSRVALDLKNPLIHTADDIGVKDVIDDEDKLVGAIQNAKKAGHDALIIKNSSYGDMTVVFNDRAIKRVPFGSEVSPEDFATLAETGAMPAHGLGADVTTEPSIDTPLTRQPASPAARLMTAAHGAAEKLFDIGRDMQMLTAPMARGTVDSMAIAKGFANTMRRNRWDWSRIDADIESRFDPEQRKRMWDAADEESVLRQEGQSSEHMGLATLEPEERQAVEDLQARSQMAWLRARDIGMVEGEGLPSYTPRMVLNVATVGEKNGSLSLNAMGRNLRTRTAQMLRRKYLTAEETEAAAQAAIGPDATIARDIRALPLATAKLEDAIAGRTLINNIKEYGKRTGDDTVVEGAIPADTEHKWFTMQEHPAFMQWRPKMQDGVAVKDEDGNAVFEKTPIYVRDDFEGPLRAVLSRPSGPLYSAMMSLKGKTMGLIMNSPLIHNAVEWGRAMPAMPGKVLTFKVYFDGNRVKNDPAQMHEAINSGLVPIGHRFFNQDISSIMEEPNLTPGRSFTAKLLGAVPDLFDPKAGDAVKRAIDKAGDFWHNTLLWDRVGDLQAGLYSNFRDNMLAKGIDRGTATKIAAHFANRFAGSLPVEAMSDNARKVANMLMFSRTFTLGNLGVMKDMLTGLPKDVLAQIERDAGFRAGAINEAGELDNPATDAVKFAKTLARRKAMAVVLTDIGLMYVGNSMLQSTFNVMRGDHTLDQEMHGYAQRFSDAMSNVKEHPLALLQPFDFMQRLSATYENEPGKQDRIKIGYAKDGTAIYARNPVGKIGEEFEGWMTGPLDMMRRKLGTIARPAWQIMSNDAGFGRKVYDPNADTPAKYIANLGRIAAFLAESQLPEGQISAASDLVKGEGDSKVNELQAFGPIAGVTFAKGAPGGPAVGELYHARQQHEFAVDAELPDIRRQILRGDVDGARERMTELGIPAGLQRFYVRTTMNPATRLSPKTLRDFYNYATPEQKARLEGARQQP